MILKITDVEVSVRPAFNKTHVIRRAKNKRYVVSFQMSEADFTRLFTSPDPRDNIEQQIVDAILKKEWLPEHIAWVKSAS